MASAAQELHALVSAVHTEPLESRAPRAARSPLVSLRGVLTSAEMFSAGGAQKVPQQLPCAPGMSGGEVEVSGDSCGPALGSPVPSRSSALQDFLAMQGAFAGASGPTAPACARGRADPSSAPRVRSRTPNL